jgi:tellurite resistance protein
MKLLILLILVGAVLYALRSKGSPGERARTARDGFEIPAPEGALGMPRSAIKPIDSMAYGHAPSVGPEATPALDAGGSRVPAPDQRGRACAISTQDGASARVAIELSDDYDNRWVRARGPEQSPAEKAKASDGCWIRAGGSARIAGLTLDGGMIYVGKDVAPVGGWEPCEPALINTSLSVSRRSPDRAGNGMTYWPSYSRIPGDCRAAYLQWLAGGRSDPDACIGYVFLFFYGLERRLLFDLRHLPERQDEAPGLLQEIERLLGIYGANRSFRGYATSLVQTGRALWEGGAAYERSPSFTSGGGELPVDVRLAVGQLVADGKPIPGDWALAWVIGHPETRLRSPARRCREEFRELFLRRFAERFGDGMASKPNQRRLRVSYHAASASFGGGVEIPFESVPDVATLSRPLRPLREIAEAASLELESYSRFIGRNPEGAGSLQALALLPQELAQRHQSPETKEFGSWMESLLADRERAIATGSDVMGHWECASEDRIAKAEMGSFAQLLESFGYGIEPDPRFGGGAVGSQQKVVLFRLGPDRASAASPAYRAAALLLHLAAAVAASDREVSEEEKRHLEAHLERSMGFGDAEIRRLRAHLHWLLVTEVNLRGLKRRVDEVGEADRNRLAQFAVAIAGADGLIDHEEVKTLSKIYRLLGLEPNQAYGDIHSLTAQVGSRPATSPVTVRPAEAVEPGYAIRRPPQPAAAPEGGSFRLDMDRVERTLANTAVVSNILSNVFEDADESEANMPGPAAGDAAGVAGLDAAHSALLRALAGRAELARDDFEELADELPLLADGAFETLNEAAFERLECPLLEGDDPIMVDLQTLEGMMR